jgi:hypothetical protein
MSNLKVNTITDASGGNTATINGVTPTTNNVVGVNRIINGDMRIDQRNAGASVTQAVQIDFPIDRFSIFGSVTTKFTAQRNAGSVTPPVGFTNYLGITSSSAYTAGASELFVVRQLIEGFNVADLAWGTAAAATVTLSFWVRSSLTGTFGGAFRNSDGSRSYPFSYTISAANTWEQKTVTVSGDTSGTWLTNNGIGLQVVWGLGCGTSVSGTAGSWSGSSFFSATGATSVVGTNGATFYITGVQLEKGSVATAFERRLYGQELALCQRYYEIGGGVTMGSTYNSVYPQFWYKVTKRATPTVTNSRSVSVSTGIDGVSHWYQNSADSNNFQVSWTASAEL